MNIDNLAAELAAGHPGTGNYDQDAEIAADQLNAVNCTLVSETRVSELGILDAFANPDHAEAALAKLDTASETDNTLARALKYIRPGAGGFRAGSSGLLPPRRL